MPKSKLSAKQERFCREYVVDCNATQAAIRAGYAKNSADVQGARLLGHARARDFIAQLQSKVSKKLEISADFVLGEFLKLASVDVSKAYGPDGKLLPLHEIPEDIRKSIAGIETIHIGDGDGVVHKLKFWDKTKALTALGQHLKLFTEAQTAGQTIKIIVSDYRAPEEKK